MSATQNGLRGKVEQLKLDFPNFSSKYIKSVLVAQSGEVARARLQLAVAKKQADEERALAATLGLDDGSKFESPFALAGHSKERGSGPFSSTQPLRIPDLPARSVNLVDSDLNTSVDSYLSEKSDTFYSSQSSTASSDLRRTTSLLSTSRPSGERKPPPLPPRESMDAFNTDLSPFALAGRSSVPTFSSSARPEKREYTIPSLFRQQQEHNSRLEDKRTKRKRNLELSDEEFESAKPDFYDDIEEIFGNGRSDPAPKRKKLIIETEVSAQRLSQPLKRRTSTTLEKPSSQLEKPSPHTHEKHLIKDGSTKRPRHGLLAAPLDDPTPKRAPTSRSRGSSISTDVIDLDEIDGSATVGNDSNLSESPSSSTATSDPIESHFSNNEQPLPFTLCSQEPQVRPAARLVRRRFLEESD